MESKAGGEGGEVADLTLGSDGTDDSFDRIAVDLQELRQAAGPVSYAELVRRISELRLERGVNSAASILPRSTVHYAFKGGRSRMDTELVRDIVLALGAGTEEADAWVQRCRKVQKVAEATKPKSAEAPVPRVPLGTSTGERKVPGWGVALILVACVGVNLLGLHLTAVFKLSVYLDMVGTGLASVILGPWHGAAVALVSSNLGFLRGDPTTIYFAPVNIVGALIWGYGIRRFRMGTDFSRFVSLNMAVALGCTIVAVPTLAMVFGGHNGHASVEAILSLEGNGIPMLASLFSANIVTNALDKLVTGVIVLMVFVLLHTRAGLPADHFPLVERLSFAGYRSPKFAPTLSYSLRSGVAHQ